MKVIFSKKGKTNRKRFPNFKTFVKWKMNPDFYIKSILKKVN